MADNKINKPLAAEIAGVIGLRQKSKHRTLLTPNAQQTLHFGFCDCEIMQLRANVGAGSLVLAYYLLINCA